MFFPILPCEELLIATSLEYMTFNPYNKEMNDKYNFNFIKCGNILLYWCSFPKEFKDVCERAGKVFGMTMEIMSRTIALGGKDSNTTVLEFPKHENILCFKGKRSRDQEKISKECEDIGKIGNCLEKLGID